MLPSSTRKAILIPKEHIKSLRNFLAALIFHTAPTIPNPIGYLAILVKVFKQKKNLPLQHCSQHTWMRWVSYHYQSDLTQRLCLCALAPMQKVRYKGHKVAIWHVWLRIFRTNYLKWKILFYRQMYGSTPTYLVPSSNSSSSRCHVSGVWRCSDNIVFDVYSSLYCCILVYLFSCIPADLCKCILVYLFATCERCLLMQW